MHLKILEWLQNQNNKEKTPNKGVKINEFDSEYEILDEYYVREPYSKVAIVSSPSLGEGFFYFVQETSLTDEQYQTYEKIVNILSKEFESPTEEHIDPKEYVFEQAEIIAEKYHRSLGKFTLEEWDQIFYYVVRDLIGYGPLQTISEDPNIEDISCNGLEMPIYVWHRMYESIPTNIRFTSTQSLNDFLVKLAHKSGKHISSAQPVLDAMLPEKHRLAATFMNEVSMKGSTFCIRKFKPEPFSIVDLIEFGTINERIAAYFWLILEHKKSFMIVGGTGAGKTSMLNSLLSLMSQNEKIVTVEEVPELSPPVTNWTQLHSRESFNFGDGPSGDITLFDLIKVSLRYRPDYVIVGEIRGEEAYVLFQALATGHGGLCTMHADSIDRVVKRLTSPPMNVSEVYIPLMNVAMYIQRVELPSKKGGLSFGRRLRAVSEIVEYNNYVEVARWDPREDAFDTMFWDSYILQQISVSTGLSVAELLEEIEEREEYLKEIVKSGIKDQRKIAEKILSYQNRKRREKNIKKETMSVSQVLDKKPIKIPETKIKNVQEEDAPQSEEINQEPVLEYEEDNQELVEIMNLDKTEEIQDIDVPQNKENLEDSIDDDLDAATKMLWELAKETNTFKKKKKLDPPERIIEEAQVVSD